MAYEDFFQQRVQEVRDGFLNAVGNGSTTVEQVTGFRDRLQEINEGKVTSTSAGVDAAVTILQQ